MHKTRMAVLASVLAGLLLLTVVPVSAGMESWQYQRKITVRENSGGTLRDYQVLVYLDGGDIRFTNADGVRMVKGNINGAII